MSEIHRKYRFWSLVLISHTLGLMQSYYCVPFVDPNKYILPKVWTEQTQFILCTNWENSGILVLKWQSECTVIALQYMSQYIWLVTAEDSIPRVWVSNLLSQDEWHQS